MNALNGTDITICVDDYDAGDKFLCIISRSQLDNTTRTHNLKVGEIVTVHSKSHDGESIYFDRFDMWFNDDSFNVSWRRCLYGLIPLSMLVPESAFKYKISGDINHLELKNDGR